MNIKKYLYETAKYALRSYPVIRPYVKKVEALYAMTPEELNKRNEERFLKLFRRAYDRSPFYHKLYTEAGIRKEDITCLEDIKKLPVITKDMVKAHADEMLTVSRRAVIAAKTSGTTGTPLKVYEDWPSIWWRQAYTYYSRLVSGFKYGQPLASLRGNLDKGTKILKIHINNTLYFSSYNINPQMARFYYEKLSEFKPVAIEGYPSSLYTLALMLRDANKELHIPVAFTSSETLLDYQRELVEAQLHTKIFDRYGMTESTIYLVEKNDHTGYYDAPGFSINEFLEDGEICTSLINMSFPLIRYRSNDVIEIDKDTDNIRGVVGRVDDIVVCKDGSLVSRIDFIEKGSHIKACQWVQHEKGKLIVNIVPEDGFTLQDRDYVIEETVKRVGRGNMDITPKVVSLEELEYTARGKFKLIVNTLDKRMLNDITGGVKIKRILGRMDDYLVGKNGEICQRLNQIAKKARHSKAMQMIQNERGKVNVTIVPDGTFTEEDRKLFIEAFEELVGVGTFEYNIRQVADIKDLVYTSRGKFKMVINNLNK